MSVYLITGGAGFIGGCLVRQLIDRGDTKVINLDKLTYAGNPDSLAEVQNDSNYIFVKGDIGDRQLISKLLNEHEVTGVINLAAESHVDRSIDSPDEFVQTNVVGTFQLLHASLDYFKNASAEIADQFRFLHVSTDEVYGSLGDTGYFTESTPYAPNSPYSASKAASDHFVRAYHHTFGMPTLVTNCSNNYGPYQFPEKLIPKMILNAIDGKPLPVYGDGMNIRDWLYVEDHTTAILEVMKKGRVGQEYNIGGNCERTNLDVVHAICDTVDKLLGERESGSRRGQIEFVTDRPGHDRRYAIDCSKIENELGWTPNQTFESGLAETIQWYIDNREGWVHGVISGGYRDERLGKG